MNMKLGRALTIIAIFGVATTRTAYALFDNDGWGHVMLTLTIVAAIVVIVKAFRGEL
jgi:hypothetical protein